MNFEIQILNLSLLIQHWDDIKTPYDFYKVFKDKDQHHSLGVCNLGYFSNIPNNIKEDMFNSWESFSGCYKFPIKDVQEYSDMELITENPLRLDFAKHCLKYLFNLS